MMTRKIHSQRATHARSFVITKVFRCTHAALLKIVFLQFCAGPFVRSDAGAFMLLACGEQSFAGARWLCFRINMRFGKLFVRGVFGISMFVDMRARIHAPIHTNLFVGEMCSAGNAISNARNNGQAQRAHIYWSCISHSQIPRRKYFSKHFGFGCNARAKCFMCGFRAFHLLDIVYGPRDNCTSSSALHDNSSVT